jgi:putative inorganic carbon (HCO3(-)) transporter
VKTQRALEQLAAGLAAAELPIVLLIAPALLFPTPTRMLLALLVPLTWVCHRRLGGRWIPATPLNASVFVLLVMTGVSLFATFDITFSLGKVSGVVLDVLLFWAVTRWMTNSDTLKIGTGMFLLAGAGLAVVGLLGTNWIGKFSVLGAIIARLPRAIRGVPGAEEGFQPNAVAGCLVLFVPLQVALLATAARHSLARKAANSGRGSWLLLIQILLLLLIAGTLLLTQSRGAWVGLLAATVAFFAWHSRRTAALAAIAAGAVVVLAIAFGPERLFDLAVSRSGPGMAGNVSGRVELWSRAIYGIQDFPLTGMGMNAFRKVLPVLYPTFLTAPDFDVAHAHNHLLQAALDLGIPGLIAYLSIWLVVAALLVRVYRRAGEPAYRTMAGGLGAGLIAHFVFSMTDAIPLGSKVGVLFWLTLGLVVSLHQVAVGGTPSSYDGAEAGRG